MTALASFQLALKPFFGQVFQLSLEQEVLPAIINNRCLANINPQNYQSERLIHVNVNELNNCDSARDLLHFSDL